MAPLILAYDAECGLCRRWVGRIQARDRHGLVVAFPLQDRHLPEMAPELAGRDLYRAVHAVDAGTRRVFVGAEVLGPILRRLPGWAWLGGLAELPGFRALAGRVYRRIALGRRSSRGPGER